MSLTELDLFDNGITSLPPLHHLSHLQTLSLSNNAIASLPDDTFSGMNSLIFIAMQNNDFSSLPSSLGNLSTLVHLDIRKNEITTLPDSFRNLSSLQELRLSTNLLVSLPYHLFQNIPSINNLDVQDNCFYPAAIDDNDITEMDNFDP